jgi:nitroimidazol reductase NimA-like FMN-containing flavoprotein (pyridoxamine 5'-phosphate oxidase superfamily)
MKTIPITDTEHIRSIINQAPVCYIALVDEDGAPYALPMNFGYDGTYFYLHSGQEHSALPHLRRDPRICLTLSTPGTLTYRDAQVGCSYSMKSESIVVQGTVDFPEDLAEKRSCLDILMRHYTENAVSYGDPAVRNIILWRITPLKLSARSFGNRYT